MPIFYFEGKKLKTTFQIYLFAHQLNLLDKTAAQLSQPILSCKNRSDG